MLQKQHKPAVGWLLALALGILAAVALSVQIVVADPEAAQQGFAFGQYDTTVISLDEAPKLLVALAKLRQNLPWDSWAWGVCAAAVAFALHSLWQRGSKRPGWPMAVMSAVFGVAQVFGQSICKLDSWAFIFENSYQLMLSAVCMAGYAVLFYHAAWGLFCLLGHLAAPQQGTGGRFAAWWQAHTPWAASGAMLLCWLPWLVACWPGSVDWDSHTQISQILGDMELTAHHTVLSTWLHGGLVALGRALGSDNLGVFLYILLQTLLAAYVFGQMVGFAKRLGCPRGVQWAATAFFALVPAWGAYMQTMVKDTLFTVVFAWFVLLTANLLVFGGSIARSVRYGVGYGAVALLTCLLRPNGSYAVLPTLLVAALCRLAVPLRKAAVGALAGVALCLFAFNFLTGTVLGIPGASAGEALSIPFQQTARYVKNFGDSVTEEEKTAINAVLNYDALAEAYDPAMSDKVKATFKDPDGEAMTQYFRTWLAMFFKNPVCYLQAFHAGSYGYYTVANTGFPYEYYIFNNKDMMAWQNLDIHYLDTSGHARYILYNYALAFDRLPLLGLLTNRGFMSWLLAALGYFLLAHRKQKSGLVLLPLAIIWLTCIASPVNDLLRYFLPVLACIPLVFALAVHAAQQKSGANR